MKSSERTLKEVLNEFMKSFKISDKIDEMRLKAGWEKVMGKMIAVHTVNLYLKNKTLFITLDSAALKNELSYAKKKIINMLNKEFGTKIVEEIVIR
jgi:predicted nucleic acid-binding Zn ribbon protein